MFVARLVCLCVLLAVTACSTPAAKLQAQAKQLGLQSLILAGGLFQLAAFYQPGHTNKRRLHVYLEGDGRPWQQGFWPAADPTTRSSVMLPLMAMDGEAALYLGRPCYNGHADDKGCAARLWTSARYGEEVVGAMAIALKQFCQSYGFSQVVLMGHSGGGSLAMLLAHRIPQTALLITLAGNYDIDVWTDYHHYLPLNESINPAKLPDTGIPEWHFLAKNDVTVPADLFLVPLQRRIHSDVEVIPAIDHQHGWQNVWPKILKKLSQKY